MQILINMIVFQRSLKLSLFFFFFCFFCSVTVIYTILSSSSLIQKNESFSLYSVLLIPSSVFFISIIVFFYLCSVAFLFSNFLLTTLKFLLLVSISPLPTSWIIFMIMTLNSFIGKLPIYTAGAFISFLCLEHVPRPPHSVYVVICTFMYVVG